MSATLFVFIGYLLFVALNPIQVDLKFFGMLLLLAVFVDVFGALSRIGGGGHAININQRRTFLRDDEYS